MGGSPITTASMKILSVLAQQQQPAPQDPPWLGPFRDLWTFIEPYKYFLLILIIFWFFARRSTPDKEDFNRQAQAVLEEKYKRGEISQKAYEKYRQDISIRPRQ
jgi:hypothetical protein